MAGASLGPVGIGGGILSGRKTRAPHQDSVRTDPVAGVVAMSPRTGTRRAAVEGGRA